MWIKFLDSLNKKGYFIWIFLILNFFFHFNEIINLAGCDIRSKLFDQMLAISKKSGSLILQISQLFSGVFDFHGKLLSKALIDKHLIFGSQIALPKRVCMII